MHIEKEEKDKPIKQPIKQNKVMKYIAIIGQTTENGLINSFAHFFGESKSELKMKLKKFYNTTVWQEKPDTIGVYEYITESNGYEHTGKELFRVSSKRFWAR